MNNNNEQFSWIPEGEYKKGYIEGYKFASDLLKREYEIKTEELLRKMWQDTVIDYPNYSYSDNEEAFNNWLKDNLI